MQSMMFISVILPEPDGPKIATAKSRDRRFKPAAEHAFYYFNPR